MQIALHGDLLQVTAAEAKSSGGCLELQLATVLAGATSQHQAVFARPCFSNAHHRWS